MWNSSCSTMAAINVILVLSIISSIGLIDARKKVKKRKLKHEVIDVWYSEIEENISQEKIFSALGKILRLLQTASEYRIKEIGIFDVRKWIIYGLIFGSLYGYGYLKGIGNKPVNFDMRGKEAHIKLNEHFLHILPSGSAQVVDKEGNILKTIAVKDIPELRKKLKPMGFDVNPFFTAGGGIGNKLKNGTSKSNAGLEAGIGSSFFKFYKVHLNAWLTNRGIYLGPDYQLTENFSIITGMGKGWEGGTRGYIGGKWRFW